MLQGFDFVATLPAGDIERAKAWYRDKLGMEPVEEYEGGIVYRAGPSTFQIYPTQFSGIADLGFERSAWFKDSEGNILAIAQFAKR